MSQTEPQEYRQPPPPPQPPRPKPRSLFLPIFLITIFVVGAVFIAMIAVVLFSFRAPVTVKLTDRSVLRLRVEGNISEYAPATAFEQFFDNRPLQFHELVDAVQKARIDPKIEGMHLQVGISTLGWAQTQELADALRQFKEAGKWIIASGEIWEEREYYLAVQAEEIFMAPEAVLALDGFMTRVSYYAALFEKYGIGVHVEALGEYKSYGDTYVRESMAEPVRESTRAILEGVDQIFSQAVTANRNLTAEVLATALDQTVYDPKTALEAGLLDGIKYLDEIEGMMAEKLGIADAADVNFIPAGDYIRSASSDFFQPSEQIAVLYAVGGIRPGPDGTGIFGDAMVGSDGFVQQLKSVRENRSVKAIVIRIDSPGGAQLASDVIWRELRQTSEMGIPVIASMGSVAASGGYYLAMGCDQIVAQPTTITGSIGVVGMRWDFQGLYKELLVNVDVVKTAPSSDFFDPYRALTESEIEAFRVRTKAAYDSFVSKAALSRGLTFEDLDRAARGRPWLGKDALEHRLIDELGGLDKAVELAAKRAGLDRFQLVRYPLEEDFWTMFREGRLAKSKASQWQALKNLIPYQLRILPDLTANVRGFGFHLLALPTFSIEID